MELLKDGISKYVEAIAEQLKHCENGSKLTIKITNESLQSQN